MSSRGSPPCAIKSFWSCRIRSLSPFILSLSLSLLLSAWFLEISLAHSVDGINIFPGKNVRSAPERTRGRGRPRCAEGDILPESLLDINSIHFHVFPRFLLLYSLIFNLSFETFYCIFRFSYSVSENPASNGLARVQQIKRKFVSPRGRLLRVGGSKGSLINGLLAV